MFEESIEIIKSSFIEYKGTGMYFALYLVSIIFLLLKEENKRKKALTVFFPIFVILLIMNPLFNKLVGKILKENTYWRVYWILPMGITIAYACVKGIELIENKVQKIVCSFLLIFTIGVSGRYMYLPGNFSLVGNNYKIKDDVVYVTQLIGADEGDYKKVYASQYVVPFIRQIDASILLTYGRSTVGYAQNSPAVMLELGDTAKITKYAISTKSNYIVIKKEHFFENNFADYDFEEFAETKDYIIFKYTKSFEV